MTVGSAFRYTADRVPSLLFRAVHGTPPLREESNQEGGRAYRDPAHLGDELVERLDVMRAWQRVPGGALKRLYWDVVVLERALGASSARHGFSLAEGRVLIDEGSEWIATLMNDRWLR